MLNVKTTVSILAIAILSVSTCFAQTLEDNWNSLVSALRADQVDTAKTSAQAVLNARPRPIELLEQAAANPDDITTLSQVANMTSDADLADSLKSIMSILEQGRVDCWDDILHYITIGRFDMAKSYARLLLRSNPNPVRLLELSRENPQQYQLLEKARENAPDPELAELSGQIIDLVEEGRFNQRTSPSVIAAEVRRLSSTERGWFTAVRRLRNAGEYAIPYMLDAMMDSTRKQEFTQIVRALPQIGRDAIRPLAAALQTDNAAIKAEIIKALGKIGYPQSLGYLQYVVQNDELPDLRQLARESIMQIDPDAVQIPTAMLFYQLSERYYYHSASLAPAEDANFANIWFWDPETEQLTRQEVDKLYFNELMAMRTCEWALKADAGFGSAIGLWLASFFKAESYDIPMPDYFGENHPDASVYATTAGVEYLNQALARAVKDDNAFVALGIIEALARTAGPQALFYRIDSTQPLAQALTFNNRMVKYSAAIAIGAAGPMEPFPESRIVIENLAEALGQSGQPSSSTDGMVWNQEIADDYAMRAVNVMLKVAISRNPVLDLNAAQTALVNATRDSRIQTEAAQVLAYLSSPGAQRAIGAMALDADNDLDVRIDAFNSLAVSAKMNSNLLTDPMIDSIYELVSYNGTDQDLLDLRSAAAAAYGALSLPSQKVKNLILDQAKS